MSEQICFVVMGYGKKTDYYSSPVRVLDLDMSYKNIIKPAAEDAGLKCIRADEIVHSGTIDVPMYEYLLKADVVVADLSTSNCNAFYELGVRHALRPYTTIIVAESGFGTVFDVSHTVIRRYKHLGEDIGYSETLRMREELKKAMVEIKDRQVDDSPVYTFLKNLQPPSPKQQDAVAKSLAAAPADSTAPTIAGLVKQMESADGWLAKLPFLQALHALKPDEPYFTQQLALATYKCKSPDEATALANARQVLSALNPDLSSDPETLGLWGAIHKRHWEVGRDRADLDRSIAAYQKGFYLKNDYYNGINLAFMLNVRAALSTSEEAVADFVLARRIRRQVLPICDELEKNEANLKPDEIYWVYATVAEAWLGLEDEQRFEQAMSLAKTKVPKDQDTGKEKLWMIESTNEQIAKLRPLLANSPLKYVARNPAAAPGV